jgi:MFS family permease
VNRAAPLRLSGFRALALGYAVNELGNWIGEIALAVLVYDQTGSPVATAALFVGMQFLPAFVAQPLIARAEVAGTRVVLPALYALEAVAFGALALSVHNFSLAVVLALATIDGTLAIAARAFTRAANAAILTPANLLREGNAIFNIGFTAAAAAGPALGGVATALLGVRGALLIDVGSFLAVALAIALNRSLPQVKAESSPWRERLREGLAYVSGRPLLAALMAAQALAFVFFTAVVPVEIVYAKDTLSAGDAGYGALLTAWGLGMVAGSFVFTAAGRTSMRLLLALSTLAIGLSYLGMAAAGSIAVACAAGAFGGLGNGVQWVALLSAVQEMTADRFQARVVGLLESIGRAMPGIGFVLGGALAALFDPRATFLVAGIGVLAVLLAAILRLRQAEWTQETAAPNEASSVA